MSLAGTLDELALPDILEIISLASKTGRLTLTARDSEGLLVFRRGRIIYASSNSAREAFGSILVCMKLIDEPTLRKALTRQHRSHEERRLGRILVEMGALSPSDLDRVVQHQVEKVVAELFTWREGYFKFEPMEIPDCGEVEVDAREFLADTGLNAHKVALDLARHLDEDRHARPPADGQAPASLRATPATPARAGAAPERATLGAILAARQAPSFTAELTLEVLRTAATHLARGVLLRVDTQGISGVGHFGLPAENDQIEEQVRDLWFPLDEPSAIAEVASSGRPLRGRLQRTRYNEILVALLGSSWPQEAVVLPLICGGRTVAVLYGDNAPTGLPLPALDLLAPKLDSLMAAMERPGVGSNPAARPAAPIGHGSTPS